MARIEAIANTGNVLGVQLSQCLEAKVGVSFGSRLGHALGDVGVAQKQSFHYKLQSRNVHGSIADRVISPVISMVSENRSTVNKGKGIWNSKVLRKLSGNAFFRVLFLWTARFSVRCSAKITKAPAQLGLGCPICTKLLEHWKLSGCFGCFLLATRCCWSRP